MQLDVKTICIIVAGALCILMLSLALWYRGEMISAQHEYAISQSELSQERLNNQNLRNEIKEQNSKIEKLGEDTKIYQAKLNDLNSQNAAAIASLNAEADKPLADIPQTQKEGELLQWMLKEAILLR